MKILVFGAGIIGSVYAAKLFETNHDVTLLAREKHYENLKANGVILKDSISGTEVRSQIPLVTSLGVDDFYDLIIVTVRFEQLDEVISVLKKNNVCKQVMFMMNIPEGYQRLTNELSPKHIILGFPGIGGSYHNSAIEYIKINQQKTTIGEIKGKGTFLINNLKQILEKAGFEVAVCNNMPAWLKIHAVFITCISAAIFKEHGNPVQLAKKRRRVKLMVQSIKEGFAACKSLGLPVLPSNLNLLFMKMPQWFAVLYWQKALKGTTGKLGIAPHANAATDEMKLIAKMVLDMVYSSCLSTPTLNVLLLRFIGKKPFQFTKQTNENYK